MEKYYVKEVLKMNNDVYVTIQYGRGGLINQAWRNKEFINKKVKVKNSSGGHWFDLPLHEFMLVSKWAMEPEIGSLEGISLKNAPHYARNLFRVAKFGKISFYIYFKGGNFSLKKASSSEVLECKNWKLNYNQINRDWISSTEFLNILQEKGINFQ